MALFDLTRDGITPICTTTFSAQHITERYDLQRILRDQIHVIAKETMVLAEEFGSWDDSRRRIDLLCLAKNASLVVVELKRTEDGGHLELQAIRYAAMVSTMTFEQAVEAHAEYRTRRGIAGDAAAEILTFLDWDEPDDNKFATDVSIVLVAADFSKEVTTSVLWLNERDLDIVCVRLRPYQIADRIVLDVEQVIPLREAEEFQIKVREKARAERKARASSRDTSPYDITINGMTHENLSKRDAILHLVKELCAGGASPDEIAAAMPWSEKQTWFVVDGTLSASDFDRLARESETTGGRRFDPIRWRINEADLIYHGGKSYALSSQWGATSLQSAVESLANRFPKSRIACAKCERQ